MMWTDRLLTMVAPVRTVPVQILKPRPRHSSNTPSVATSFCAVDAPLRASGRKTTRSRSTPMPGPMTRRAIGAAISVGQPHSDFICQYMYAQSMAMPPYAKLKMPVAL